MNQATQPAAWHPWRDPRAATSIDAQAWVDGLEAAWRARDVDAVAALFAPDAIYFQGPFGEPHRGPDGIRKHWIGVLDKQIDPRIWFDRALQDGHRGVVEWWCILHDPVTRVPRTGSGVLTMRFAADGRCTHFHEYWHRLVDTALPCPENWHA
ncbi:MULTISPECIES: nuclear transport factor 2 family protein [unclassified Burkholderia]|uniref:nuclear transport factor 2 family protein n=1 Tax=unclassified Burkholderia TaxID=2613784 RepID=UPI001F048B0E|nr:MULTISPECIES: nuclear transport factor 2 family protein [unclassified Burkholderia]